MESKIATSESTAGPNVSSGSSLKDRVVLGVKWQLAGQVFTQGWRFVANLILTRLLLPEMFGVAAILYGVLFAVRMLSDVGLRDTVIHNKRGDCPEFLNTVWTIQIIRGFVLGGICCLMAYPLAVFYDEPQYLWLMPIAGLGPMLESFSSSSLLTAGRHILAKWNVITLLTGNFVGSVAMILIALVWESVAAIVLGNLVNVITSVYVSYQFGKHIKHRFHWDREAAKAVSYFGRWTIPSSCLTIFMQQGDKLVLGAMMTKGALGLYSIGANLAMIVAMVFDRISNAVLQPLHSRVKDKPIRVARSRIRKFRLCLLGGLLPGLWTLIFGSRWLFEFLYREQYRDAFQYCVLIGFGISLRLSGDMGPILQAHGHAKRNFKLTFLGFITQVAAMLTGYAVIGGPNGVIWGIVFAPLLHYPFRAYEYHRLKMWQPEVDLLAIALSLLGMFAYYSLGLM